MSWKNPVRFMLLTVTLASLTCCHGQVDDTGALAQRPSPQGRLHFKSVVSDEKHQSAIPTRYGSLTFNSDKETYQTSSPVLHSFMDAKLKRLNPSVQCSDNSMTLKVKWDRAPHFLVNNDMEPHTPLSQMPSHCGYSVKRSRRDLLFSAPYQGCQVTQQGGDYVLPLRLWGAPMTMSCPAVLPPPSVSCFPSGMVVKIVGVAAKDLKVKVSGTWNSLSSICGSCGFAVEVFSGGLTITAPYNRGVCIEIKDEEYLLSLLLADVELLVTCPSLPRIKPTIATTMPPSDSGQLLQPYFPQFHLFPHYSGLPGLYQPTHSLTPATGTVAPLAQQPWHPLGPAAPENQEALAGQHRWFPFVPQYPHSPQYVLFPTPAAPIPPTTNKKTATTMAHAPQMPQSKDDGRPLPQWLQFPVPPQYHIMPFPKLPLPPGVQLQTIQNSRPVIQQPKPQHLYPQTYQIPVLHPPPIYPPQFPTAAPTTTSTTTAAAAAQKPFYYPHPYMQFYPPQQAPMPALPDPPTRPKNPALLNPALSHGDQEHQPVYRSRAMPLFYPFPFHQRPKSVARK